MSSPFPSFDSPFFREMEDIQRKTVRKAYKWLFVLLLIWACGLGIIAAVICGVLRAFGVI